MGVVRGGGKWGEEDKEGEKEEWREERERGRKGGKERRAQRVRGSQVFTEHQYTHMYGEYNAPYIHIRML